MCLRSAKDTGGTSNRRSGWDTTIDFKCFVHIDGDDAEAMGNIFGCMLKS
jgi:hypothetical protein